MSVAESSSKDSVQFETIQELRYRLLNNQRQPPHDINSNAPCRSSKDMSSFWCRPDASKESTTSTNQSGSNSIVSGWINDSTHHSITQDSCRSGSVSQQPSNRIRLLSKVFGSGSGKKSQNSNLDSVLGTIDRIVDDAYDQSAIITKPISTKQPDRLLNNVNKNQPVVAKKVPSVVQDSFTSVTYNESYSEDCTESSYTNAGTSSPASSDVPRRTNKVTPYCPWTQKPDQYGIREWVTLNENEIQVEAFAYDTSRKTKANNNSPKSPNNVSRDFYNTMSPQDFLDAMIFQRGYSTGRYQTLDSGYYNEPTALQEASYTPYVTSLVDQNDVAALRTLLTSGLSSNPSNYAGSTLAHYVCRVGRAGMLRMLLEIGCDIRIADSGGRTPLHEVCKRKVPCFDMVEMIMRHDVRMFFMVDHRDTIPLGRVPKEQWVEWNQFLDSKKDSFWPIREYAKMGDEPPPPLTLVKPNTRIVPDPRIHLPIHEVQRLASGGTDPDENSTRDSITWVDDWPKSTDSLKDIKSQWNTQTQAIQPSMPPINIIVSHSSSRSTKQNCVANVVQKVNSPPETIKVKPNAVSSSRSFAKSLGHKSSTGHERVTSSETQIPSNIVTSNKESRKRQTDKSRNAFAMSTTSTAATKTCMTGSTVTDLTVPKHDVKPIDLDDSVNGDDIEGRLEEEKRERRERRRSKSKARSKSRQRTRRKAPSFYIERVAV